MIKKVIKKEVKRDSFLYDLLMKIYHSIRSPVIYFKKKRIIPWKLSKKFVEIELTSECNLKCFNCNRSVRQAPTKENLSLDQIRRFINESISVGWKWDRIGLIGGEPTMHPQILDAILILKKYQDAYPYCEIQVCTNGFGKEVVTRLKELPSWVIVVNSNKKSAIQEFSSYNDAPIDSEKFINSNFTMGCFITDLCGLGFTKYGYYACGPGASVDRVFGFDIGIKKLSDVNDTALRKQLNVLCRYCGHYKDNFKEELITKEVMSESWKKAYSAYKKKKSNLSEY